MSGELWFRPLLWCPKHVLDLLFNYSGSRCVVSSSVFSYDRGQLMSAATCKDDVHHTTSDYQNPVSSPDRLIWNQDIKI